MSTLLYVAQADSIHTARSASIFVDRGWDFQSGGYLTLAAKQQMSTFPVWVAANLGSDIYHFQQYPDHRERIKRVLAACDYYACECHRDVLLANNLGLKGDSLPVTPIAGGLRFDTLPATVPPSQRRCIAVSVTDGISTSMLEAMAMGAFPIQSNTACADEWFTDGVGGFLVDPNDVDIIAARLSHALCDDNLVDTAARINRTTLHKIDYDRVANDLHKTFQSILR